MSTVFCGDCKLMPADRCLHQLGRRAATPVTDAYGCSYYTPKQAAPAIRLIPPVERCPWCQWSSLVIDGENRYCHRCGNAWKGVWSV
jgi:hypothetical protein